jgi:hypothetical protein
MDLTSVNQVARQMTHRASLGRYRDLAHGAAVIAVNRGTCGKQYLTETRGDRVRKLHGICVKHEWAGRIFATLTGKVESCGISMCVGGGNFKIAGDIYSTACFGAKADLDILCESGQIESPDGAVAIQPDVEIIRRSRESQSVGLAAGKVVRIRDSWETLTRRCRIQMGFG